MVGRCTHERRLYSFDGTLDATLTGRARVTRGHTPMHLRVTITIKLEIALTAAALGAILLLFS